MANVDARQLNFTHPRVEPQPVCVDRLTISRSRVQRLIEKADQQPDRDEWENGYAQGAAEVLDYLLNADNLSDRLAETLGIHQ